MSPSRKFSVLLTLALLACAATAQTPAPATPPPSAPSDDKVERLDRFVVSSGPDAKTSFDLAQGTSVLAGDDLHRLNQGTLGEALATTPGVSATYYGPGASRP